MKKVNKKTCKKAKGSEKETKRKEKWLEGFRHINARSFCAPVLSYS
ncbi:hypothetical protein SDC9_146933 [bioreactor metagenome]|uniref:Uncharacterized protein n=1 Tax=bioreactor metagenome TaxID=1076179 RepID=A0A645EEJ0_9ZZZZ